ncbi:8537_t:CDS:1, partial [Scutellospora calospora]
EQSRGRGMGITEAEIDDLFTTMSEEYRLGCLPRLWKKISDVSLESLHSYYLSDTANNDRFPFLDIFFKHEKNLYLIKNLSPILKFVQILKSSLEYQVTRQEARDMTFRDFINRESNNGELQEIFKMLHSAFEKFEESWSATKEHVKRYRCQQFNQFPNVSLDSSVTYGLIEEKDE